MSTRCSTEAKCRRVLETTNWIMNSDASPAAPVTRLGRGARIVEASTEPKATVMAKSKLDILAKLRSPVIRVSTSSAR